MNCAVLSKVDDFMQSKANGNCRAVRQIDKKGNDIMFMTRKQIIMRRIKGIATALAIVAMYAAMVGVAVLLINNF